MRLLGLAVVVILAVFFALDLLEQAAAPREEAIVATALDYGAKSIIPRILNIRS